MASRRMSSELRRRIMAAEIDAAPDLDEAVRVVPPGRSEGRARILFDPDRMEQLAAEHRYPEWVLAAMIDRRIATERDRWLEAAETAEGLPEAA